MNEHRETLMPSVEAWRGEFMTAAENYAEKRNSWWRRWLAPFCVLVALAGTSVATAEIADQIYERGEIPHAYLNLETGEPIMCPSANGEGTLLLSIGNVEPTCPEGKVPQIYYDQLNNLDKYHEQNSDFGESVDKNDPDAPDYKVPLDELELDSQDAGGGG